MYINNKNLRLTVTAADDGNQPTITGQQEQEQAKSNTQKRKQLTHPKHWEKIKQKDANSFSHLQKHSHAKFAPKINRQKKRKPQKKADKKDSNETQHRNK